MAASKRFVCIHGHFYQPPRENPWLETVELQDSAAPYHDWNERICAECYAPNGAARIVNEKNQIKRIVNNYARISFNYGPTLLSWLKENAPRAYRMILDGERRSRKTFHGHSSAMAQVYNHIILPLASRRDRVTQIRWGIADYESHYGAPPEGMWLAETAADTDSLELMAQHGIKFTVLAPHQCKRIRPIEQAVAAKAGARPAGDESGAEWTDTANATVDTTRPYLVRFESGVSIAVFFYDGPSSRAIAFEGLLNSGESYVARLKAAFKPSEDPQLVHVATDGESYGHHHRHGEMALAYALRQIEQDPTVNLANYGRFLAQFPPEYEAEIIDNTSWSCAHGIERWRSDCGCNGGKPEWNQAWRGPLRQALDELRDALVPLAEQVGNKLFKDVWLARDGYIQVVLDRSQETVDEFFRIHSNGKLTVAERVRALQLMELERHTQLMYTSCGWFFDDISGIETVQIIAYAARVLQLAKEVFPGAAAAAQLEPAFLARLAKARSNVETAADGAHIYKEHVLAMELNLEQVAAHYAISRVQWSACSSHSATQICSMRSILHFEQANRSSAPAIALACCGGGIQNDLNARSCRCGGVITHVDGCVHRVHRRRRHQARVAGTGIPEFDSPGATDPRFPSHSLKSSSITRELLFQGLMPVVPPLDQRCGSAYAALDFGPCPDQ